MKSVLFRRYGDPAEVLAVEESAVPEPRRGEVRVRMLAAPVNPSDLLYVRGLYGGVHAEFPARAGFEGVGIVDDLGSGTQDVARGQRVSVLNNAGGNWAEYTVVSERDLIPVAADIPDEQAASFVVNPASAILMLHHALKVPRGEWLLQSAAASQIGRMMIRLAKRAGIKTINVVRRRESVAELKELGADAVIVSAEGPIDEQVRSIAGPEGVRYAVDPVAGETGTQMFKALHEEGRMLLYGSLSGEPICVGEDPRYILAGRRVLEVFWGRYWVARLDKDARHELTDTIAGLIREGTLETKPGRRYSFDDIGAAVTQAESVGKEGKVLLTPG